ncbi:hypothetical protein FRC12_013289 [Ceratobasidium sp. 428]|nr:hypothetical protein FRC12_013289 [Ceratobasidium sp. 428]
MRVSFAILALAAVASASSGFRRQAAMPACAMQCIMAADTGSCDQTDNTCLCKSDPFVQQMYKCMSSGCPPEDLDSAVTASRALCMAAGVSLTQTVPASTDASTPTGSTPSETQSVPAGSTTPAGSATGSGSAAPTAATSRASGSSTAAAPSGSPNTNGAVGSAGVSGMVGALAAVAGFMFAL